MAVLHWQVSPQTAWHVENISYLLVMLLRPHMFCLSSYVQARSGDIKQHLWWCSLPCNSLCAAASGHVLFNWLFSKAQIGFILWCSGQSWGHMWMEGWEEGSSHLWLPLPVILSSPLQNATLLHGHEASTWPRAFSCLCVTFCVDSFLQIKWRGCLSLRGCKWFCW